MARFETAADAINGAALEALSLPSTSDPFSSADPIYVTLCGLLKSAGRELITMREWQRFIVTYPFVTTSANAYNYPVDYGSHIDQTDWDPANRLPLAGPLTSQDEAYLENTNLASSTIYLSFYEEGGQLKVLPNPPPVGRTLNFKYMSRYWVAAAATPTVLAKDAPTQSDDIILFEPILIMKFLKLRFLEAKGFDTTAASQQFENALMTWGGKDKSAPVLNASRSRSFPYLDKRNVPETNYGLP